jgi:hypothetical protein
MNWALILAAAITLQSQAPAAQPPQEPEVKKVPKDSVEIVTAGCLKGRVFTAVGRAEEESTRKGPNVTGMSFRVSGKKDVMKTVKDHDGHFVEISGLVLKSSIAGPPPGARIGNTRVTVGPGRDPLTASMKTPGGGVPVMDISALRDLAPSCPIERP